MFCTWRTKTLYDIWEDRRQRASERRLNKNEKESVKVKSPVSCWMQTSISICLNHFCSVSCRWPNLHSHRAISQSRAGISTTAHGEWNIFMFSDKSSWVLLVMDRDIQDVLILDQVSLVVPNIIRSSLFLSLSFTPRGTRRNSSLFSSGLPFLFFSGFWKSWVRQRSGRTHETLHAGDQVSGSQRQHQTRSNSGLDVRQIVLTL